MTVTPSEANRPAGPSGGLHPSERSHAHDSGCGCGQSHAAPFDAQSLISARGLVLRHGARTILEGVDVDIHPREIVTLIGPNGSGKTSLVRVLLGLQEVSAGAVHRRAGLKVGYVPQRFDIDRALPMTVERFLSLGINADRAKFLGVLAEVGAERCFSQQLSELSGGELQRVLLARALAADPDLLVLDEPVRRVIWQE